MSIPIVHSHCRNILVCFYHPHCIVSTLATHSLLVLCNVQFSIKMLIGVTCLIEIFIIELFIEDTQYFSFCCARYILFSIPSIQIQWLKVAPELWLPYYCWSPNLPFLWKTLDYMLQLINQSPIYSLHIFHKNWYNLNIGWYNLLSLHRLYLLCMTHVCLLNARHGYYEYATLNPWSYVYIVYVLLQYTFHHIGVFCMFVCKILFIFTW